MSGVLRDKKSDSPAPPIEPEPPQPPAPPQRNFGGQPPSRRLERSLLKNVLKSFCADDVRAVLWDGSLVSTGSPEQRFEVRIASRRILWKLLAFPDYYFLDGYSDGSIEIDGDIRRLTRVLVEGLNRRLQARRLSKLGNWLFRHGRSRRASRYNIAHHYDIGNDFYRLWLDEQLVYTCAYFADENDSLERAQIAKMDHVCRKLQLRPGESVIEAGCGWGAFALHMARRYGVRVRAFNISKEQLAYARERARQEGLDAQVEFVEDDWRGIRGRCDAFVSIGMLEHVGPEHYGELGRIARAVLPANGRGLFHSIGLNARRPLNRWIEQRIFPGAQPPTLWQMKDLFEPHGLVVTDVENLRLHYAQTLEHWLERFEHCADAVQEMFDERFVRIWRLYLVTSIAAFETGALQLYQVLYTPTECNAVPRTRAHLYC